MSWVTIKFSPEAKHFWKWLHTWLGVAAASASVAYENLDSIKDYVSPTLLHYLTATLVLAMVYNSTQVKKK